MVTVKIYNHAAGKYEVATPLDEINAMGCVDAGEGRELEAFISNEGRVWAEVERCYRYAELAKKNGEYVKEYLEGNLFANAVGMGAREYVRQYCPRGSNWRELFPLEARRACARLLVEHFEGEISAGNFWLHK